MKRLSVKEEVCMACRLCEVHCLVAHSISGEPIQAYKKETPRPLSRVRVEAKGVFSRPMPCLHCPDPPCVSACLTGAIYKDEATGLVKVDEGRCMGCWVCVAYCPYGAIVPDFGREIIVKCDLCPHLPQPACVAFCPNEAVQLVEE